MDEVTLKRKVDGEEKPTCDVLYGLITEYSYIAQYTFIFILLLEWPLISFY